MFLAQSPLFVLCSQAVSALFTKRRARACVVPRAALRATRKREARARRARPDSPRRAVPGKTALDTEGSRNPQLVQVIFTFQCPHFPVTSNGKGRKEALALVRPSLRGRCMAPGALGLFRPAARRTARVARRVYAAARSTAGSGTEGGAAARVWANA